MLKFTKSGNWRLYWGDMPLPTGAIALGTIQRATLETGALLQLATGVYVQGNAGALRTLDQRDVAEALQRSDAAAELSSTTSDAKAAASRANGLKGGKPHNLRGGRPRKNKAE